MAEIEIVSGDITSIPCSAIVNAANPSLLGGGGVDGAIHRAAGPGLLAFCSRLPLLEPGVRCRTGQAVITPAFDLPCEHVIHTVGPVWRGGGHGEDGLLADCYRNCLSIASSRMLASVAFPAISCGAYGFPIPRACSVALESVLESGFSGRVILTAFHQDVCRNLEDQYQYRCRRRSGS